MESPHPEFVIRTHNKVDPAGLDVLLSKGMTVDVDGQSDVPDAILLRSYKLVAESLPASCLAIGRAGAGVNNIPIQQCTERSIVVFNTPGANANAVVELALSSMLGGVRRLRQAQNFVMGLDVEAPDLPTIVEDGKKRFRGTELDGKTLGIIGLGAIGSKLASVATSLGMRVWGYDPHISVEHALRVPNTLHWSTSLDSLLANCDVISMHIPQTPETIDFMDGVKLAKVKRGCTLLNFSREGLVHESAVLAALTSGRLSAYITDFPSPELIRRQQQKGDVLLTPHLGASTEEAERNCAIMAGQQLADFLLEGTIRNSVNFPAMMLDRHSNWRLAIANSNATGALGGIMDALSEHSLNVAGMSNESRGEVAWNLIDLDSQPLPEAIVALEQQPAVRRVRLLVRA